MVFRRVRLLKMILILGMIIYLVLLYNYTHIAPVYVTIEKPTFSLLGPYETTNYELDDVYDQLIDLKNFSFKMNPQPCRGSSNGLLLVVIIHSKTDHFKQRDIIRRTWGRPRAYSKVVFLLGQTDNVILTRDIKEESVKYGDVVQGGFKDSYRNMTYKHVMGLKWVSHHCPQAKYVLKVDDDVVVNTFGLWTFLARALSPWGARGLLACQLYHNSSVVRDGSKKWTVTEQEYTQNKYPDYCAGFVILYSRDVVPRLLSAAQKLPFFWVDDVHVTGTVARKVGVVPSHLTTTLMTADQMKVHSRRGVYDVTNFVFAPPNLSSENMTTLWKFISV